LSQDLRDKPLAVIDYSSVAYTSTCEKLY